MIDMPKYSIDNMLDFYQCEIPVICGPMAWIGTYALCSEVINGGAAAYLGIGNGDDQYAKNQIDEMKERVGNRKFGANILSTNPSKDKVLELILKESEHIGYVSFSAFLRPPKNMIQALQQKGIKTVARIGSTRFIELWVNAGIDSFDAEGNESGGHLGPNSTKDLIPSAVEEAEKFGRFVVAAGGFYDNRDLEWVFNQGSVGMVLGSRFAVSEVSIAHENYKNAVQAAKSDNCTVIAGQSIKHPVRALINPFSSKLIALEEDLAKKVNDGEITDKERREDIMSFGLGAMKAGLIDGDLINGSLMIGVVASKINEINEPVIKILQDILQDTPYIKHITKPILL